MAPAALAFSDDVTADDSRPDFVRLYIVPRRPDRYDIDEKYDDLKKRAQGKALRRFVAARHDLRVFGQTPIRDERNAVRNIFKNASFVMCSRLPVTHARACRFKELVFVYDDGTGTYDGVRAFRVHRDDLYDRIVLPRNELSGRSYIPVGHGQSLPLPISDIPKRTLERIIHRQVALAEALMQIGHMHTDARRYQASGEQLRDADVCKAAIGKPNRVASLTREAMEFHRSASVTKGRRCPQLDNV